MKLNFQKAVVGQSLNFSKDFGDKVSGVVSFNLNWGKFNGQSVDLDAFLVMENRNNYPIINAQTVTKPKSLCDKLLNLFGLYTPRTIDLIRNPALRTETVYFGNPNAQGVIHHGDDRTGAWSEGEFIEINLDHLHPSVDTLTFSVLSYSGHRFSDLPFASIKVFTGTPTRPIKGLVGHELLSFKSTTKTVVMAQMTKNNQGEWLIKAMNHESTNSSSSRVDAFCKGIR